MYSITIFIISLLALFGESKLRFKSPFVLLLSFSFLTFFIGFRDQVGTDWELTFSNFFVLMMRLHLTGCLHHLLFTFKN